jgi:RimJ/RimL family protein N-acetyltransferase
MMISFRPATLDDVPTIYGFRLDDDVMYWASGGYGDALLTLPQLEEQVRGQRASDANRLFVIEVAEESGPRVIGTVTFRGLDRISRRATIGMMIGEKRYWGKGYGTAVVRAFTRFLFTRYNLHRIDLDTFAENERAIRCYKKCGFVVEGVLRKAMWTVNGYRDQVMMGLLREDWEKMGQ